MVLATVAASAAVMLWALNMCIHAVVAVLTTTQFRHTHHRTPPLESAIVAVVQVLQVGSDSISDRTVRMSLSD
jgi:hypothetical protein